MKVTTSTGVPLAASNKSSNTTKRRPCNCLRQSEAFFDKMIAVNVRAPLLLIRAAYPHLKRVAADDTAGSVRRAVESGDVTRAGIGGRRTADIYGGKILREHIEDHAENYTRFALLSPTANETNTTGKISLVIRLRHQPGALHNALRAFVRRGIDLLKIESRPIKDSPSEFYFYLDLRSPDNESELRGALDEISEQAAEVRYLGRYPTVSLETQAPSPA